MNADHALLLSAVDPPLVAEAVRTGLEPFLMDRGFHEAGSNAHSTVYESAVTRVTVVWDPRGEINVAVSRVGESNVHAQWSYGEITSPAAVPMHIQRVVRELSGEPGLLAGDAVEFERLRHRNEQRSKEWTAYYSGQGPHPKRSGRLP